MADYRSPLESPEVFAGYCNRVKQQVQEHVQKRICFLESVHGDLVALECLAREAGNQELVSELAALAQQARRETDLLRGGAPLSSCSPGPAPRAHDEPAHAAVDARAVVSRGVTSAPVARPVPAVPHVAPRTREEIYQDVDELTRAAEMPAASYAGVPGLLRLKGLLCTQRALQAELAAQDIQHWSLRQLLNHLRRRVDEEHGPGHYLIPLRAELWPAEPWPWQRLAKLYHGLADAYAGLAWFCAEAARLSVHQRQDLLECIGAHQTRVYRHLQGYFPRQNDEHQINLFRDLCALAEQEDVYLFTLQERCSDDMLEERAEALTAVLAELQSDGEERVARDEALESLAALVANPEFGEAPEDGAALAGAVKRCRDAGVPASSAALRASLLDRAALLDDLSGAAVEEVRAELHREWDRHAHRRADEDQDRAAAVTPADRDDLEAARAVLLGKHVGVFVGVCRPETRSAIVAALDPVRVTWLDAVGAEGVRALEPQVERLDVLIVLLRTMREGGSAAQSVAGRHGKPVVRVASAVTAPLIARAVLRQTESAGPPAQRPEPSL